MVSHDVNLAAMYGDNILLLKNGTIESMGRLAEVLTAEVNRPASHLGRCLRDRRIRRGLRPRSAVIAACRDEHAAASPDVARPGNRRPARRHRIADR